VATLAAATSSGDPEVGLRAAAALRGLVEALEALQVDNAMLVEDDNPAVRVQRAHGLTSETVRAGIDRLVAQGVLPGPQPSDAELLAAARGEDVTPAHWLLALLRDLEDPVEADLDRHPVERRKRAMVGEADHGPSPVRLLVESQGGTLDQLRAAVLEELDRLEV
jgi:Clp amino terminal domain, pathogenicity island component